MINVVIGIIQLVCSVALAVAALYLGFRVFKKITHDIDESREFARGNIAIGILIAALFIGISLGVGAAVQEISLGLGEASAEGFSTSAGLMDLLLTILQFVAGLVLSVGGIYLALRIFDHFSGVSGKFSEIVKGNVAVSAVLAGIILCIAVIIHSGVLGIITIIH